MPTRRVIKSVLNNFLGTYISRYSDYQGYWIFGFLVENLSSLEIDLQSTMDPNLDSADAAARTLAIRRFAEQLGKSLVNPAQISNARLLIERLPGSIVGPVNGRTSSGHSIAFRATATTDTGRHFACEKVAFVATHNPQIESRITRVDKNGKDKF